jgi:hypothetical protein
MAWPSRSLPSARAGGRTIQHVTAPVHDELSGHGALALGRRTPASPFIQARAWATPLASSSRRSTSNPRHDAGRHGGRPPRMELDSDSGAPAPPQMQQRRAIRLHARRQLQLVHTSSEVTVGERARRLLHSSRSGRLDLRSRSSSQAGTRRPAIGRPHLGQKGGVRRGGRRVGGACRMAGSLPWTTRGWHRRFHGMRHVAAARRRAGWAARARP